MKDSRVLIQEEDGSRQRLTGTPLKEDRPVETAPHPRGGCKR